MTQKTRKREMQELITEFANLAAKINLTWEQCDAQTHDDLAEDYPFNNSFDEVASNIRSWSQTINDL